MSCTRCIGVYASNTWSSCDWVCSLQVVDSSDVVVQVRMSIYHIVWQALFFTKLYHHVFVIWSLRMYRCLMHVILRALAPNTLRSTCERRRHTNTLFSCSTSVIWYPLGWRWVPENLFLLNNSIFRVVSVCNVILFPWLQTRWVSTLSAEYPTLAFHASLTNSFGKGSLIHLLRQFAKVQNHFLLKKNVR